MQILYNLQKKNRNCQCVPLPSEIIFTIPRTRKREHKQQNEVLKIHKSTFDTLQGLTHNFTIQFNTFIIHSLCTKNCSLFWQNKKEIIKTMRLTGFPWSFQLNLTERDLLQ